MSGDRMDLTELKRLHDKAYTYSQVTRERAADDLVFYWVTQWDDNILAESQLAYRGEFNILRKAGRAIIADLEANQVQVDFEPVEDSDFDSGDFMDQLYRTDDNNNRSENSYNTAKTEAVVCGVGAWVLHTEYETIREDNNNQVIRRRPVWEANNTLFWDPNSKLIDRSDADYCSILTSYSYDAYIDLVKELTGDEDAKPSMGSFKHPEQSYVFPWLGGEMEKIYVAEFYHRKKVKVKALTLQDPVGSEVTMYESDLINVLDDFIDTGYQILSEREVTRYEVTRYVASGERILDKRIIAGENIPVVPVFGEYAMVEGEVHYEGVTRLAKDPQRLRNFQMSYLADIVSRSPRQKPIFFQEQVAGFEDMYSISGIENNYPYLLQNRLAGDGSPLPVGPPGLMPEQKIPDALIASMAMSREGVEDVANPGTPQNVADTDISGKAVLALQSRIDLQSVVYQSNFKHAKKRDGEVYASMAAEVYDVPRPVILTSPDGTRKKISTMDTVIDQETGDIVTINDIYNQEFNVYADMGPSYASKREQTIERLAEQVGVLPPGDPLRQILLMKLLKLMDGVDFADIRDYANMQLVLLGIKQPETPEEQEALVQAQQQGQEPSPEMLLAMGENKKGEAALMKEQINALKLQIDALNKKSDLNIDAFKAQTDRMDTQIDAQKASADIDYTRVDTLSKQIDNSIKVVEQMTDQELLGVLT